MSCARPILTLAVVASTLVAGMVAGASGAASVPAAAQAGDSSARRTVDGIAIYIEPRTREQLEAFYAARGLPAEAVEAIAQHCFFTVGIRNGRSDAAWLIPARWQFVDGKGQPLARVTRAQWNARWDELQVPSAARSAFGWTQLPEERDLQPDEPVGGNIAVAPSAQPFTLVAQFPIGARDAKRTVRIRVPNLRCGGDAPATP